MELIYLAGFVLAILIAVGVIGGLVALFGGLTECDLSGYEERHVHDPRRAL